MSGEQPRRGAAGSVWERALLASATAVLAAAHAVFFRSAGPLWRDELNSYAFAAMPSWSRICSSLRYDSFPLLPTAALRAWIHAPWGAGEAGVRAFGLITGLAVAAALWWCAREVGRSTPWVSLPLFGFNLVAIRAVDAIRPYGLGALAILLAFALMWRCVLQPSPLRILLAAAAAIASVQCLYPNAFFVLAICTGGMAVCLKRRDTRRAGLIAGIGAAAAVSLVPYVGAIRGAGEWAGLNRFPGSMSDLLGVLGAALGAQTPAMIGAWALACGAGLILTAAAWKKTAPAPASPARGRSAPEFVHPDETFRPEEARLYAACTLVVAATSFMIFLDFAELPTQPWYYVPLMALAATCCDALLAPLWSGVRAASARAVLSLAIIAAGVPALWSGLHVRQTNVDRLASALAQSAAKEDFILVNPWYFGVSFGHYYEGAARWESLPPLEDLTIHRYDLLKLAMLSPRPIDATLRTLASTLRGGHRVWLVGGLPVVPQGQSAPVLEPAPASGAWRWNSAQYLGSYGMQAAQLLQSHAQTAEPFPVPVAGAVSVYERVPVYVVSGWRDAGH